MDKLNLNNDLIAKALEIAAKAHEGQKRKGTDIPYIVHPVEVALILQENGADAEMIAAGLLHDVLEDGKGSLKDREDDIRDELGKRVLDLVKGASEKLENREETSWCDRKQHTIDYLKDEETPMDIKIISCADKLSNARSISRDIKIEKDIWSRFKAGRECQKWYYEGLVESLKCLEGYEMYREFRLVVGEIFCR